MMAVNRDKPDRWKEDIAQSVDMYNDWFIRFAPEDLPGDAREDDKGCRDDAESDE